MKHNKKRNTAFIYETLSRELTQAIVDKKAEKKDLIVGLVKEHFNRGSILGKEVALYKTLLETNNIQQKLADRILQETKIAYAQLDDKEVFDAQSRIIATINKKLGKDVWSNFVPNFKSLASVNAIFSPKTAIKQKVLFEQAIVDRMSAEASLIKSENLKSIDNLAYQSFISKFNEKYGDLLKEQKDLLNRFITSFADDGFELRLYLNEELSRLKSRVEETAQHVNEKALSESLDNVSEYLEGFRKREFTEDDLNKILKTQELLREIDSDD